jgi:serine/threonine protein phosphatase 1
MPSRTIAIGDIHGCATALKTLVQAIAPGPADTLIPLGDVIDRGPQSRQVIEQLLELRARCQLRPVLGNHEEMLLNVVVSNAFLDSVWRGRDPRFLRL